MPLIHEIGNAVRARRFEMGLSQDDLAAVSGLSRSTISAVEGFTARNLSVTKAEALLESIGLALQVVTNGTRPSAGQGSPPPARSALDRAAATASVSYDPHLSGEQLQVALLTGEVPQEVWPHLRILLDEGPMSLLAKVVDELHTSKGVERAALWARMRELARQLQCFRRVWR